MEPRETRYRTGILIKEQIKVDVIGVTKDDWACGYTVMVKKHKADAHCTFRVRPDNLIMEAESEVV